MKGIDLKQSSIYYPADIQLILKINKNKALRWINIYSQTINRINNTRVVNFLSLIEIYVINRLLEFGVSHSIIKKAYKNYINVCKCSYPFATQQIYTFNGNIYIKQKESFVRHDINLSIDLLLDEFSQKISYNQDNIAQEFYPLSKNNHIIVNPEIQAGEPVIKGTRIPVEVIYQMLKNEEEDTVKSIYGLNNEIIEAVRTFYN